VLVIVSARKLCVTSFLSVHSVKNCLDANVFVAISYFK
jgi:hypothetical protein